MRKLVLFLVAFVACHGADPRDIAGDWKGTLTVQGRQLRLLVHIQKAEGPAWKATLDSVDQGVNGIPVKSVSLDGNHVNLDIAAITGSYDAQISADGNTLKGTWKQASVEAPLSLTRGGSAQATTPEPDDSLSVAPLLGIWEGALEAGAAKLRLRFTLSKDEKGAITGKFDSLDQGAMGLPITDLSLKNSAFHFALRAVGGKYDGTVSEDKRIIRGTWSQGAPMPLEWKKVDNPTAVNRPQEPKKPYPYREEEVQYPNKAAAGVELAGTLTIPPGTGPFPAVVLISGSGPQDRDESLLGHKPFWILADHLTRKGIAVLRFDDRGVAKSKGDHSKATSADFATDALAGIEFLKTRPEVNKTQIGLIGHSEGGVIGPIAATQSKDVAFLVLMAGTGAPGDQVLGTQLRLILKSTGKSEAEIEKAADKQKRALAIVVREQDPTKAREALKALADETQGGAAGQAQLDMLLSPWFRYFLAYDPAATLAKIKIPVLAINGEKDLQVEPTTNLAGIRSALEKGGNTNATIKMLPGLNHLLQTSATGAIGEYASIEETMSPLALETISSWVLKTTRLTH